MKLFIIIILMILLYLAITIVTIMKNGVSLINDPGLSIRLKTLMSTNIAKTADNHIFPELVTPIFENPKDELAQNIINASDKLGWKLAPSTNENQLKFIVNTALFNFKDDIIIELIELSEEKTRVNISSISRKGKADFGANIGHILKLKETLKVNNEDY